MEKIDFVNSQQPAINDTNLNLMQDNIEMAINAQVSGDTLPVATVLPWAGTVSIPSNWLVCDGRAISRETYYQLFAIIGTRYGEGDGSTTFNIPDMRGKIPVGYDSTQTEFDRIGETGGEKTHTLTVSEMPSHRHTIAPRNNSATGLYELKATNATGDIGSANTGYSGGGQAHNNLQPYIVQRYIIKVHQSAGTVAEIVNAKESSLSNAYSTLYINNLHSYSTTEKVVGTWIDGKPIYRKVHQVQLSSSSPDTDIIISDSLISNIDNVISITGSVKNENQNWFFVPRNNTVTSGDSNAIGAYYNSVSGVHVLMGHLGLGSNSKCYIVIEYTKTTD